MIEGSAFSWVGLQNHAKRKIWCEADAQGLQ